VQSKLSPPSLLLLLLFVTIAHQNLLEVLLCCLFFCNRKQVTVDASHVHGQKVMGQANQRLGKLLVGLPKSLHFCAFFGVSAVVAVEAWEMMADHSCLPPNPEFLHYLWALAFMPM
jgi:hypothetical protein